MGDRVDIVVQSLSIDPTGTLAALATSAPLLPCAPLTVAPPLTGAAASRVCGWQTSTLMTPFPTLSSASSKPAASSSAPPPSAPTAPTPTLSHLPCVWALLSEERWEGGEGGKGEG